MRASATSKLMSLGVLAAITLTWGGCYEDSGSGTPQAQTPAPPVKEGPLTSVATGNGPASSALGKAKKTASNIAERAEAKSREVANQADDPLSDHPKPAPPANGDPSDNPG